MNKDKQKYKDKKEFISSKNAASSNDIQTSKKDGVRPSNESKEFKKRLGNVYWANSQKIDVSDNKIRRQYAVVKDNGKNVGVSKIRGFNDNEKNETRLFELNREKYPLTKRSGVDNKVYTRRADNKKFLRLEDAEVFDDIPAFKLSSHDTHRSLIHVGLINKNKKGRKN